MPLLRSSLTNGFPVPYKSVHDPACGLYSQVIHSKKWHNPESWNTDEFQNLYQDLYQQLVLPYQRQISNFHFYDLSKYLVTETFIRNIDKDLAKAHKKYWNNKGRIYFPVSSDTLAIPEERAAFFNLIRDELRSFIPEIYQYTGVD